MCALLRIVAVLSDDRSRGVASAMNYDVDLSLSLSLFLRKPAEAALFTDTGTYVTYTVYNRYTSRDAARHIFMGDRSGQSSYILTSILGHRSLGPRRGTSE
jgi:hypothetical protein